MCSMFIRLLSAKWNAADNKSTPPTNGRKSTDAAPVWPENSQLT